MAASLKAARVSFASRSLGGAGGRTRRPPCVYTLERTAYSVQTSWRTEKEEAEEAGGEDRADVRAENQPGYVATYTFCRRKVSTRVCSTLASPLLLCRVLSSFLLLLSCCCPSSFFRSSSSSFFVLRRWSKGFVGGISKRDAGLVMSPDDG